MQVTSLSQLREQYTVKIRRSRKQKDIQQSRHKLLLLAFGYDPLKNQNIKQLLKCFERYLEGNHKNIGETVGRMLEEMREFDNEGSVLGEDSVQLLRRVYCKLWGHDSSIHQDADCQGVKIQQRVLKILTKLAKFKIFTLEVFDSNGMISFILCLLQNENHRLKIPLLFIIRLASDPHVRDRLAKCDSLIQKLAYETGVVADNLQSKVCIKTNRLILSWWSQLEIQDYKMATSRLHPSICAICIHAIKRYEDYSKQNQDSGTIKNVLTLQKKYYQQFKGVFVNLQGPQLDIQDYFALLTSEKTASCRNDLLEVIALSAQFSPYFRYQTIQNQVNISFINDLIDDHNYDQKLVVSIIYHLILHPNLPSIFYEVLSKITYHFVFNEFAGFDVKSQIWKTIQRWFEKKCDSGGLSAQDIKILCTLASTRQKPFNLDLESQFWYMVVAEMGYVDELPHYITEYAHQEQ